MIKKMLRQLNYRLVSFLAGNVPPKLIEEIGNLYASLLYSKAVHRVPAYKRAVKETIGEVPFFITHKNYRQLPILDKNTYLNSNELTDLTTEKLSHAYSIQRSSGFSGSPTYWLKTKSEAHNSAFNFHLIWKQHLNPDNEPALVIVGFSLGTWTSGTDLLRLSTDLALNSNCRITSISPGEDVDETLEIIRNFGKHFRKLVVFGNPVYIKRLVDEGRDIDWKTLNVVFVTGGEPTTEAWREYIAKRLEIDVDKEPMRIVNAYGASDFGATTATETPLSIKIKRLAMQDPKLAKEIFGRQRNLPNLFQYSPFTHHIEQHKQYFLVTYWSHVPLIRYNIGDRGRVFSFNELKSIFTAHGYDLNQICGEFAKKPFKLPFLFVDTRDDGTISIGGANVYPANIETALLQDPHLEANVEHFYISVREDENFDSKLIVELIVRDFERRTPEWLKGFAAKAAQAILKTLLRDNAEYKVTWEHNHLVSPLIYLSHPEKVQKHTIKRKYIKAELDCSEAG